MGTCEKKNSWRCTLPLLRRLELPVKALSGTLTWWLDAASECLERHGRYGPWLHHGTGGVNGDISLSLSRD